MRARCSPWRRRRMGRRGWLGGMWTRLIILECRRSQHQQFCIGIVEMVRERSGCWLHVALGSEVLPDGMALLDRFGGLEAFFIGMRHGMAQHGMAFGNEKGIIG